MPQPIEAADLSHASFLHAGEYGELMVLRFDPLSQGAQRARRFLRAIELLRQIRAANPDLSFEAACKRALRLAYLEHRKRLAAARARQRVPRQAA
jgi:hypothetical protein